jgi:hypothetical protein
MATGPETLDLILGYATDWANAHANDPTTIFCRCGWHGISPSVGEAANTIKAPRGRLRSLRPGHPDRASINMRQSR